MDPQSLKRILIFALLMNMTTAFNSRLQCVTFFCVQHRTRQWKLASEIFKQNSDEKANYSVDLLAFVALKRGN